MTPRPDLSAEWLETDGLGGFASGTVGGVRTRRYHALLLTAQTPPTGRMVLVNGFDAFLETPSGVFALSSQRYSPDVVHPDGQSRLAEFTSSPWPRWVFALPDGTRIAQEIFVPHGRPSVVIAWKALTEGSKLRLRVRPFFSGRDYHGLHHENPAFGFSHEKQGDRLFWRPYEGVPAIEARTNAAYRTDPVWYRNFQYDEERNRGLDYTEDLASPGELSWNLNSEEAVCLLTSGTAPNPPADLRDNVSSQVGALRETELKRRGQFKTPLHRAADAYFVNRGRQRTLVAGYPWFTDWGRDTFIALRGLGIATGRFEDVRDILLSWVSAVSNGMMPNRFPDRGEAPEYNSVDASLWYVVAVYELLGASEGKQLKSSDRQALISAADAIVDGFHRGTRHGIHATDDGLLACGEPGVQLTWMDAKVGDWVVTPRIGKPVEIQALWINALWIASRFNSRWQEVHKRALTAFQERFWNAERNCLYDVVDADHQAGRNDAALRPNQIFAVGGLPAPLLEGERARRVVEVVADQLLTPMGLRTLGPKEAGYCPRYGGGVRQRDGAYHQGTVWPWLLGPFVEAWLRISGDTPKNRERARKQFLTQVLDYANGPGMGHLPEITDAETPQIPRGCPWQAWSLGELLRLQYQVLA